MRYKKPTNNHRYKSKPHGQRILYDARGARVKSSPLTNKYVRVLLFWVLPYFVINGLIFLFVCASPRINIEVKDTNNYVTSEVKFTVKSFMPIKDLEVSLESSPIEYVKSGSTYTCTANQNGTFAVKATSLNGMQKTVFADVSTLDDTAPSVEEDSASISKGILTFNIYDTQSGVNYDSIYGIVDGDEKITPFEVDKDLGIVSMQLPVAAKVIELHFSDMVGNARSGRITVTVGGVEADNDEEADNDTDAQAETEADGTEIVSVNE